MFIFVLSSLVVAVLGVVPFAFGDDLDPGYVYGVTEDPNYRPPVYYDVSTGNVTFDVTEVPGGRMTGYALAPDDWSILRADEHTPFMNTTFVSNIISIGETNFSEVPAGVYSIGNVLPPGLTREQFEQVFERATPDFLDSVMGAIGGLGSGFGFGFTPIYAPSPLPPLNSEIVTPQHERWASRIDLIYDPTDGNMTIDTTGGDGGAITTYSLQSTEDVFFKDNVTPITESVQTTSQWADNRADPLVVMVAERAFGGIPEGRYDLGQLMVPGLSLSELADSIDAKFIGYPGHGGQIDVETVGVPMAISIVPEPTGIGALCWLTAVGLFSRIRRHPSPT